MTIQEVADSKTLRKRVIRRLILAVAIPVATLAILTWIAGRQVPAELFAGGSSFPQSPRHWQKRPIGANPVEPSWITHVQIVDLDRDSHNDVVVCDARHNRVLWMRQTPAHE